MPDLRAPGLELAAEIVVVDDWQVLKDARLVALQTSPASFLASYEVEVRHPDEWWAAEASRGDWLVAVLDGNQVGLLGVTAEPGTPDDERFLSYLWVHPELRRSGLATALVTTAINRLREARVARVWLWVLDGNHAAWRLYERLGFRQTGLRQQLPHDPSRYEERLARRIA